MAALSPDRNYARRLTYLCVAGLIMVTGLIWRLAPLSLPPFYLKYGGSVLWSAMLYCLVAAIRPFGTARFKVAALAILIAAAIELSRLVHTPALDAFRLTLPGALLLGHVFSIWDIVAYAFGIAIACLIDCASLYLKESRKRLKSQRS